MANKYTVRWSPSASDDLVAIGTWIARDNPRTALEVLDRLEEAARSLDAHPERGRLVREVAELGSWQEIPVPPWRIVYRVDGSTVRVLGVFDACRELRDILFHRLVRPCF